MQNEPKNDGGFFVVKSFVSIRRLPPDERFLGSFGIFPVCAGEDRRFGCSVRKNRAEMRGFLGVSVETKRVAGFGPRIFARLWLVKRKLFLFAVGVE